jgi:beta-galactosidase
MIKRSFDGDWEFTEMTGMFAMMFAQWQPVTLPHDASIAKPRNAQYPTGSGGGFAWSGTVTYRKTFHVPEDWKGKAVQLEFEGVYMNAEVLVNGHLAAFHPYGYTSFLVDLSPYVIYGKENQVTVVANNSAQPNSRWYSGTGIYRHVWLRLGGGVHIQPWGVFVTTPVVDPAASQVSIATEIANSSDAPAQVVLRSTALDASGEPVAQVDSVLEIKAHTTFVTTQELTVSQAKLWSVEAPNLYTLASELLLGTEAVDSEKTVFGIRSIAVDAKNGFRLNDEPIKLQGGCVHHDNGLLGAASYDRAEERKVELMKSAGFNAIRCAHNPPAPAMLDACDRLGLLVIDETFDCWRMGKTANDYHLYFEDWWQRDTEAMVRRDRNHPSVVMWSIGNEVGERSGVSDGYAWCRRQVDFVRALDHTRFITSALPALFEEMLPSPSEGNMEQLFDFLNSAPADPQKDPWGTHTREFIASLDIAGYNYLSNRYQLDGETFPDRVICGTETWPHQAFAFWDATSKLPFVIGDFVWTAIDYLGEAGIGKVSIDEPMVFFAQYPQHLANCGDLDICGFKRPQSYYRDILWGVRKEPYIAVLDPQLYGKKVSFNPWGWEPMIDSWTFPGWEGKPTVVEVYCADDEVELLLNGVSVGRKPTGAVSQNKAAFDVTYEPGMIVAIGYTGGKETGRTTLTTAGEPAALRLTPDRTSLNRELGDLAYVTAEVVDQDGAVVKYAEHEVSFEVAGAGELLAVGTADPVSEELYVGCQRKAFQGHLMAVIRSMGQAGEICLKASADGLAAAELRLRAS